MTDVSVLQQIDANQVVADNLHAELRRQRWSDRQAAVALGVTHTYVSRRTRGATPLSPADLLMFAGLLEIPVSRLFFGTDGSTAPMKKAPSAHGEGQTLLELDSNQQPIGYELAPVTSLTERITDRLDAEWHDTMIDRDKLATVTVGAFG